MASLSDLLNPAPADEASATRRDSAPIPPLQIPTNPYAPSEEQRRISIAGDASGSGNGTITPFTPQHGSQSYDAASRRVSESERTYNDAVRRSSGSSQDNKYQHTIPSPDQQMLRKLSSPVLQQQYASPSLAEKPRRASMAPYGDQSYRLPPLHQVHSSSPVNEVSAGQEHSDPSDNNGRRVSLVSPAVTFPAYTPAPTRTVSDVTSAGKERDASATPIKTEIAPSLRDSIPPFVPVASVNREQSSTTHTPMRDVSAPIPSTEEVGEEARGTKRPAPKSASKKGMAKKGPPAKKQKTEANGAKSKTKAKPRAKKPEAARDMSLDSSPAPSSTQGAVAADRMSASPADPGFSDEEEQGDDGEMASADDDSDLYCICKKPDTGTFMIGCDGGCDDWFHGKCVGIQEKDKGLIDKYMCPNCVKKGKKNGKEVVTTWKRMCRRHGCRNPARLAVKDAEPSKYCSDACGVEFFRDVMGRTRGAAAVLNDVKRPSRKKEDTKRQDSEASDRSGPKGGVLNKGELKALVTSVRTFDDFKRLGDGVLSPPATPSPTAIKNAVLQDQADSNLNGSEIDRLAKIDSTKKDLTARYSLLKDHTKFINILRQTGQRLAEAKGMKGKDACGYDERARWDEVTFSTWRESADGQSALKSGVLDIKAEADDGDKMDEDKTDDGPCLKRKCAKHYEWAKLALETIRFESSENSENMRALEREEKEIKERAGLRARQIKAGEVGGVVEMHDRRMEDHGEMKAEPLPAGIKIEVAVDGHDDDLQKVEHAAGPAIPTTGNDTMEAMDIAS